MPTLADTKALLAPITNWPDSASIAFLAARAASAPSRTSGSTIANSSPPNRATMSDLRTLARSRPAH